jgi:hypothetical protein
VDATRLRQLSKELLGNKYRLEIGVAIWQLEGAPFFAQALADDSGLRYPRVQEDLKRLAAAQMLQAQPAESGGSAVYYKATQSIYWELCAELHAELIES